MTEPDSDAASSDSAGGGEASTPENEAPGGEAAPEETSSNEAPSGEAPPEAPPQNAARASLLTRAMATLRSLDLIPRSPAASPWRKMLPEGPLGWITAFLLWSALLYYVRRWMKGNDELLFDPFFTNDDARTALFPFHQYTPERALLDDPIANEMKAYLMPGVWLLYRILVPTVGLFWATKWVQAICLLIFVYSGFLLARSRRAGLAAAAVLVFLMLHTAFVVNRIAGGFGRSFAFPLFALWLAGAITQSERVRYAAAMLGAVTQNYAVAIILGAEGIFSVLDAFDRSWKVLFGRAKRYLLLVAACVALIVPFAIFQGKNTGHPQTVEQADAFVGFKARHRGELPFADPAPTFAKSAVAPLSTAGEKKLAPGWAKSYEKHATTGPLVIIALLFLIGLARLGPPARPALAFMGSTILIYTLARIYAFKLYSIERYYAFGMPMVTIALCVVGVGLVAPRLKPSYRTALRNVLAAGFIMGLWALSGDGIVKKNGMEIDARSNAKLFTFVKTLPKESRLLAHPFDADDIPWWSGRATTGGYETTQFWLVEATQRAQERTDAALSALYATDRSALLEYAQKYKVSHILLRKDRYLTDFRTKAQFIEPFTSMTNKLLAKVQLDELVLGKVPESAVIYDDKWFRIVDIKLLGAAWQAR